ncbi:MAG TPA: hypothetical protein VE377_22880 [Candidatus Dormibacteraeota bacterium]|nr:hypothetical protein [Candidatus Dormibacteraeota bacterium]
MKTASPALLRFTAVSGETTAMLSSRSENAGSDRRRPSWTRFAAIFAALVLISLFAACSSDNKPEEAAKPEVKGPELITARSAFQKLYVAARGWSQDAKPYRIESVATSDGKGQDGKWAVWRASFASPAQRSEKSYTWSGSAADGAPSRGINPGTEDSYSATNASTQVFDIAFLKIDSDQVLATALKHGGDKVVEKAADTPVTYVCDWNHNTNELVWHVTFAPHDGPKLTISANASTGEFIRVEK